VAYLCLDRHVSLAETELPAREKVWAASRQNARMARTVVPKLKTKEFNTLTRSLTPPAMPASLEEFTDAALSLRERVELGSGQLFVWSVSG
jgi:DNA polymerase-4